MSTAPAQRLDGEQEVIERARRGDIRAWEMVMRRHQEVVFQVAFLMTGDVLVATETTTSTLIRAYRALPGLAPGTSIQPWLIGMVSTGARAQRRALASLFDRDTKPVERASVPYLPATPMPGGTDALSIPPDLREKLRSGFETLTWDDRLTIAARYLIGLPRPDAATILATEPEEVDRLLRSALERLRTGARDPRLMALSADRLGWLVIATALSDVPWTPDVAPSVSDRLLRDAIAYPEHFAPSQRSVSVTHMAPSGTVGSPSEHSSTGNGRPARSITTAAFVALVTAFVLATVPGTGWLAELRDRLSDEAGQPALAGQGPLGAPADGDGFDVREPTVAVLILR